MENDTQAPSLKPDDKSPAEASLPDAAEAALPHATDAPSPTDPPAPRGRRRQVPPSGTIDIFRQSPQSDEAPPTESVTSADLMALTRELRRLQSWSLDSPETRAAIRAMLTSSLADALAEVPDLISPVKQSLEQAVTSLEKLIRDATEEAARRTRATDATLKATEQRTDRVAKETDSTIKRLDEWLTTTDARVQKKISQPWSRRLLPTLGAAALCGTMMIALLTGLRPGWTMTSEQREALRIGQSVSAIYLTASPKEQAEMRRVNRWWSSEEADTTTAPPRTRP